MPRGIQRDPMIWTSAGILHHMKARRPLALKPSQTLPLSESVRYHELERLPTNVTIPMQSRWPAKGAYLEALRQPSVLHCRTNDYPNRSPMAV